MEWVTLPEADDETLYGFCVYRDCPKKGYCDGYVCFILNCGKNSK